MATQDIALSLNRHEVLVKELEALTSSMRSWVALYPVSTSNEDGSSAACRVRIRIVEVPVAELSRRNNSLDGDESFIVNRINVVVDSPDHVQPVLTMHNIKCDGFTSPYFANYPL